jgi:WD40 repeat protein
MFRKAHFLNFLIVPALLAFAACAQQQPSANVGKAPTATETQEAIPVATQESTKPTPTASAAAEPQETAISTQKSAMPAPSVKIAACSEPVQLTPAGETFTYKHVQFTVYQSLGFNFTAQECEEGFVGDEGGPYYPAHLLFRAESPMKNNVVQPEIRIFEVSDNLEAYTYPLNSLDELKRALEERAEPPTWFDKVALHTGTEYLDSHYGIGVRAVVEYLQDPFIWTNNDLQYVYNGLTDDGRYFVSASFPISAPYLMDIQGSDPLTNTNPDAIPVPNWPEDYEAQRKVIDEYNQQVLHRFETTYLADLRPELGVYDFLVESVQVGVPGSSSSSSQAACFTTAENIPFAFTPDSASLLTRGNGGVRFFSLEALKETSFLLAPMNMITAAISADGITLAWSLEDNTIQLVQVKDQKVLHTLAGHTDMVTKLRFSPESDVLVSASHDGWVRVWDMQGEEVRSFQPPGEVLGIGISADGGMLATVPFDGPVALWYLDTLVKIKDLGGSGGYDTSDPVFSPDGKLVGADLATGLFVWSIPDGKIIWDEDINSMTVAFSPDGRYLAYADISDNNKVFLSKPDGSEIVQSIAGEQSILWELFFSPDSRLLAGYDGIAIRIWNVEDGSLEYIGKAACP